MKFFSKSIFMVFLGFRFVFSFIGKAFLYFLFCFSVLLSAESNRPAVKEEPVF